MIPAKFQWNGQLELNMLSFGASVERQPTISYVIFAEQLYRVNVFIATRDRDS